MTKTKRIFDSRNNKIIFFVLQSVHSVEVFQRMKFFVKGTQDKVHHAQMKKNVVETP